jgi:hypothetical protein
MKRPRLLLSDLAGSVIFVLQLVMRTDSPSRISTTRTDSPNSESTSRHSKVAVSVNSSTSSLLPWLDGPLTESYQLHPTCQCARRGPPLAQLEALFEPSTVGELGSRSRPWAPTPGSYVGPSTCDRYTSALGAGQRVLSYTYYTPWRAAGGRLTQNGLPNDRCHSNTCVSYFSRSCRSSARYAELLQTLATGARELYPGWRLRVYHNVTTEDTAAWSRLCALYCTNPHVDLCDTRRLPTVGDLNSHFPIGRFWRFQVVGDPTVELFGCRDVDSYLLPRERAAVHQWLERGATSQFHIMRDEPFDHPTILAGLWGANNYINFSKALAVRSRLLDVRVEHGKFYDQAVLHDRVWPIVR